MKNLLGAFGVMMIVILSACGGEECKECSGTDPFFGLEINADACENGDGTITVTSSVLGISQDTTYTGTLAEFVAEATTEGLTCM